MLNKCVIVEFSVSAKKQVFNPILNLCIIIISRYYCTLLWLFGKGNGSPTGHSIFPYRAGHSCQNTGTEFMEFLFTMSSLILEAPADRGNYEKYNKLPNNCHISDTNIEGSSTVVEENVWILCDKAESNQCKREGSLWRVQRGRWVCPIGRFVWVLISEML